MNEIDGSDSVARFTREDAREAETWVHQIFGSDVRTDGAGDEFTSACHEVGHMLISVLIPGSKFSKATLHPTPLLHDQRCDSVDDRICMLLGGAVGELVPTGRMQPGGCWGDLVEARGRALLEQPSEEKADARVREQADRAHALVSACGPELVTRLAREFLARGSMTMDECKQIARIST